MDEVQILPMREDDYDAVRALWMTIRGFGIRALDDSREDVARFIRRNPTTSFVALWEDAIVGVILAGHDGRRGYIYHTAVLPAFRGRGIARQLVEQAMTALEREGIHKAALVVFARNALGNGFWESIGFSTREDLVYRNQNIHPLERIDT